MLNQVCLVCLKTGGKQQGQRRFKPDHLSLADMKELEGELSDRCHVMWKKYQNGIE